MVGVIWHCGRGWGSGSEWYWQWHRARPGEGYHRANGKKSSNELSWEKNATVSLFLSPKCKGEGDQTRITRAPHTHTHTHTQTQESSNPLPNWPKGKETLVLINPSNKECRGHDPSRAGPTGCWSLTLVNKTWDVTQGGIPIIALLQVMMLFGFGGSSRLEKELKVTVGVLGQRHRCVN